LLELGLRGPGPLLTTRSKKRFVLIGIEQFSKWCEVWAPPSKLLARVAKAFLRMMTRYGACAELLTDNGQEFAGELDVLCQKLLITHHLPVPPAVQRVDGAAGQDNQGRHHAVWDGERPQDVE
jgi:hypothetical protein